MNKGIVRKSIVLGIIVLMIGAGVVINIKTTVKADPTDGLVGYWNFDEGSGSSAYDDSGNGFNGAILGASWTTGVSGGALHFDGVNDYVDLPDNNFKFQTFSISCWASCDSFGYYPPIFSVHNQALYGGWTLQGGAIATGNTMNLVTSGPAGQLIDIVKSQPVVTSQWYHIVGVKTPSYMRIYIDGVLAEEDNSVSPVVYSGCVYGDDFLPFIGCGLNVHIIDRYFNGKIDEVRVYNRALSTSEIQYLHDNPGGGPVGIHPCPKVTINTEKIGENQVTEIFRVNIKFRNDGEESASNPSSLNGVHIQVSGGAIKDITKGSFDSYSTYSYDDRQVIELYKNYIGTNQENTASFKLYKIKNVFSIIGYRSWITDKDDTIINPRNSGVFIHRWDYILSNPDSLMEFLSEHEINRIYVKAFEATGYSNGDFSFIQNGYWTWPGNYPNFLGNYNLNNLITSAKNHNIEVYAWIHCFWPVNNPNYNWIDPANAFHRQYLGNVCIYLFNNFPDLSGINLDYVRYNQSYPAGNLEQGIENIRSFVSFIAGITHAYGKKISADVFSASDETSYQANVRCKTVCQDYSLLSQYLDSISPMAYHLPNNAPSWVGDVTSFVISKSSQNCLVCPIIQTFPGDQPYTKDRPGYEQVKAATQSAILNSAQGLNLFVYDNTTSEEWNGFDMARQEKYIARDPYDYPYNRHEWNDYFTFLDYKMNYLPSLKFTVHSPVDLHIYDSEGRHIGINYTTGEIEIEIPGANYSGPNTEPQIINIPNPIQGNYIVKLVGTDVGNYNLNIEGHINNTVLYNKSFTGNINIGEEIDWTLPLIIYNIEIAPITNKTIGNPKYSLNDEWVTSSTIFNLTATDDLSGIDATYYRIWYNEAWTPWNEYTDNFSLTGEGKHYLEYYSVDNAGNVEEIQNQTHYVDDTPPSITIEVPNPWEALQDHVTYSSVVTDSFGVEWVKYAIREPGSAQGTIINPMYESLVVSPMSDDKWQLALDTTQLPDGYYVLYVNASDNLGNEDYTTVNFSIRNWAVLENLPNTPNSKAGRTMPVKFSLRVVAAVDPTEPFVRNEELTIKIYFKGYPGTILQTSTYGPNATDYRISTEDDQYITNFKTLALPTIYVVDIWRDTLLIGSFEFATVK